MKVLIGCECSGRVRDEFIKLGHDAISCDLKETLVPGPHIVGDLLELLYGGRYHWDLVIAHPPCTYLTVTANKWLKEQPARKSGALVGADRLAARQEAVDFFMKIAYAPVDKIAIENPVGYMSTYWREPDQIIQPMQFGHAEPKKTCLWLKNLPLLHSTTRRVKAEYHVTKSGKRMPKWYAYADKSQGQEHRAEIRSNTFQGIAEAMADQWTKPYLTLF